MPATPLDCIVCGSCVLDVLIHPVPLDRPIGGGNLVRVDPMQTTIGGIVSNAGVALSRLGLRTAAFTWVGQDAWAHVIRERYKLEHLGDQHVTPHPAAPTSTTVVLTDPSGERSFLHCAGAHRRLNAKAFLEKMDFFATSRAVLIGYYAMLPELEAELDVVLRAMKARGCLTALDCSGDGGSLKPLDRALPHLDFFIPSLCEAEHQTGESDPQRMLQAYRDCGAKGLVGVKLGSKGSLLSPKPGEFLEVHAIAPPTPVVDTTGAGDTFFGGLLAGVLRGLPIEQAAKLGAATAAFCVSAFGGTTGLRDYETTAALAGLNATVGVHI